MRPKKKRRLRVEKEARRRARLGIGMPPAGRVIPDKREKPVKHKKRILLSEEDC
jgi:ribosomal protein L44E